MTFFAGKEHYPEVQSGRPLLEPHFTIQSDASGVRSGGEVDGPGDFESL